MFTLNQIYSAHSKVKSGADFPLYIQELKSFGVLSYETFVADGHTDFLSKENYRVSSPPNNTILKIAAFTNFEQFKTDLKSHQQGKTDYPTFCMDCAKSGIEKWVVDIENMTCTYYGNEGLAIFSEKIFCNENQL